MRLVALLLSLAVPAAAGTLDAPVIGGTPAMDGQFPSVVVIEVGPARCSGTLIANEWVLTAAHCLLPAVVDLPTQDAVTASVRVHFDTVDLDRSAGRTVTAVDTIPDPGFDVHALGAYDSGLIRLATPVTDIAAATINQRTSAVPVGSTVTLVGFGRVGVGGAGPSGTENYVAQTAIACGEQGDDANLLCFDQANGMGLCKGDSGGPSFAMVDGKQLEVGVTTFGDPTCTKFGAATRTEAERDFIVQHVPTLACHDCVVDPGGGCDAGGGRASLSLVGALVIVLRRRSANA